MEADEYFNGKEQLVCADCGALSPEWAILNRGVLICSECCSVHRNLGRSISQLRSLKKGAWNSNQLLLINTLYQNGANNIWEHSLIDLSNNQHKNKKKPVSNSPIIPKKESFIKAKYVQLAFAIRPSKDENLTLEDLNKQLWCCVRTSHVETTLRLLALGADPNYVDLDKGNSSLHIAAKEGQALQVELLWIYGADVAQKNFDGQTPASVARNQNNIELALRLDQLEFDVTDRFSMFLCGRVSEHKNNQHFLIPELIGQINPLVKRFRLLLQNSSSLLLERLIQDIDRREIDLQWKSSEQYCIGNHQYVAIFLPPCSRLSATRNQLRQKLAKFNSFEFSQLLIDLLKEISRRYYGLPLPSQKNELQLKNSNLQLCIDNEIVENDVEDNQDYDEVANMSFSCKSRISNSTRRSSEQFQKVLSETNENECNGFSTNNQTRESIEQSFDNYLEMKEKLTEITEKFDYISSTNKQLIKNFYLMQDIVEHLQIDQNNLKNQFDLLIAEKNFAKQTKSPINNINLSNLEIVSPKSTTNLHTKINSDKSFSDNYFVSNQTAFSKYQKNMHYRKNSLNSSLNITDETFHIKNDSVSMLPLDETKIVSSNCEQKHNLSYSTSNSLTDNIKKPFNTQNTSALKTLFNDEVFPDNLILETDLLTGAIKSLLADLQQKNVTNDANTVFHSDSIGLNISRIIRSIPSRYLIGEVRNCVNEMEHAMKELSFKCLSRPLNIDETCHAAYDVAKSAKQLIVMFHNQSDNF